MHTSKLSWQRAARTGSGAAALGAALLLAACSGGSGSAPAPAPEAPKPPTTASFELTLVNLTAGQPLTPMVAAAHGENYSMFRAGQSASVALEQLAESGDGAALLAQANDSKSVAAAAVVGSGPLAPGAGNKSVLTLTVPLSALPNLKLSVASMLGNTNDAFAGLSAQAIDSLAVGAALNVRLLAYDAGTERHSESADTVPGPASANSGGKREGYNPARDDVLDMVQVHPGIVSKDDGLAGSVLTQQQRWDNPVALLTIKRTQ